MIIQISKQINKLTFLLIFLLIMAAGGFAQTKRYTLNGSVNDIENAGITNATVSLRNMASGSEFRTQTDSNGRFAFDGLVAGKFYLTVNAVGFSTVSKIIEVGLNKEPEVTIVLPVGNISEQVNVTAARTQVTSADTAVTVTVVEREELERKNINTIGDAFRSLPGVSTVNEGSFQVRPRIRGFDSNRVLILVDGERLNNGRTSTIQSGIEAGLVGTEQIETLEVVRGSGSVLYGTDALGGTINIITKTAPRSASDEFRLGATFNGFFSTNEKGRRGNLALTGSGKYFSFRAAQSLERYDNYYTGDLGNRTIDGVTATGEVLNSQSHGSNTRIDSRFFFDENNDLRIGYDRRRAANIGVPSLVGVFNAFFPFSDRDKFSTRYETRDVTKYLSRLTGSFYYQNQNRNFTNILDVPAFPPFFPGQFEFSETITDTASIGFDIQTDWNLGFRNFVTAGVSFFRDHNSDRRFHEKIQPDFRTFPPGLRRSVETSPSVPNASFGSFAAFVQDTYDLSDRIRFVGGLRVERFFSNSTATEGFSIPLTKDQIEGLGLTGLTDGLSVSEFAATGDFGAVFKLTEELTASGRIGRSFRVPNLFERFFTGPGSIGGLVVGNPNLEPESGTNIDVGMRFRNSKIAGSATYFNNTYRNLLSNEQIGIINGTPVTVLNGLYQTVNIGRARIQGFEAEIEVPIKLGMGFLTPGGNIGYLRGDDLESNQPLTTITPLKTVVNLRWQNFLNNYYLDWTTRIVNKQERLSPAFLTVNGGAEPGYAVSDLGGGFIVKRERMRLSFNISIKNIFDRLFNEQFVFAPARGRSYIFGSTVDIK